VHFIRLPQRQRLLQGGAQPLYIVCCVLVVTFLCYDRQTPLSHQITKDLQVASLGFDPFSLRIKHPIQSMQRRLPCAKRQTRPSYV
jgi:hypothetical protein